MRTEKRPPEREPLVLRRGKNFEAREKSGWIRCVGERLIFEKRVIDLRAKRGRLDIFVQSDSKMIGIGEVKATDWDNIRMGRVRALALRHVRQTWHYIEAHLKDRLDVSPGIIYPRAPRSVQKKALVERTLNEQMIQCVWRRSRKEPANQNDC